MGHYFLSSLAETYMLMVWETIAEHNVAAADRMIDRFTAAFERLAQWRESGERYVHPKGELRRVIVSPYVIFYQVVGREVNIVRVFHSARKWEDLL